MTTRTAGRILVFAALGAVLSAAIFWPRKVRTTSAEPLRQEMRLPGTVRDFRRGHPDFSLTSGGGHDAGNVELTLTADRRPRFTGAGYRVVNNWTDAASRPIAPHLYRPSPTIRLGDGGTEGHGHATLDTFDSARAPCGASSAGPAPLVVSGLPMPQITIPSELSARPSLGPRTLDGGSHEGDSHYGALTLRNTLMVHGTTRMLCDGGLDMGNDAAIELEAGATLELYIRGGGLIGLRAAINLNTADPDRVDVYLIGTGDLVAFSHSQVYAHVTAPDACLDVRNHADFHGEFTGRCLKLRPGAGVHVHQAFATDACNRAILDRPGAAGAGGSGNITSAATFDQWFRDVLGQNLSMPHAVTLTRNPSGVYESFNDSWHAIDGALFGNEGQGHNHSFTWTFSTTFTYRACGNQFFEFEGTDDVWVFVNGHLAMDLGGSGVVKKQYLNHDRLQLADGTSYPFLFFYAQRQDSLAVFRMRTNILFDVPGPVNVSGGYD